jgi:hypothetical protein
MGHLTLREALASDRLDTFVPTCLLQQLNPAHQGLRAFARADSTPTLAQVRLLCATSVLGS